MLRISIAIPTYRRESVLLDTITMLLKGESSAAEILVVDQTPQHRPEVEKQLSVWSERGAIRWIRLEKPSIPKAMNRALLEARSEVVLFLDDDIIPCNDLASAHLNAHAQQIKAWAVVGRILQPWDGEEGPADCDDLGLNFKFNSQKKQWVRNVMAGNLSVRREKAIEIGGFDENFLGAAYRFETEFAERLIDQGGQILFEPNACIRHLKADEGGVRSYGDFQKTFLPYHSVGEYYYFFRTQKFLLSPFRRLLKAICRKRNLYKPWYIPAALIAELSGYFWALYLIFKGPKYISTKKMP